MMALAYDQAVGLYRKDEIEQLSQSEDGIRFLLLRSLSRKEHMQALAEHHGMNLEGVGARDLLRHLHDADLSTEQIKASINRLFEVERSERRKGEPLLLAELYRMNEFYWGGLHQNSLEKTIVNNYVKKIKSYNALNQAVEGKLFESMTGYVRCSWYNHWTSIMIEDIFKENSNVLPAIGLVKKIDFFVRGVPFDLKVTYLPEGYVKDRRKTSRLRPELTLLKQTARKVKIEIDETLSSSDLLEHLWLMVTDHPSENCENLIYELREFRLGLIAEIRDNPEALIVWLYENQGERRFDSANRLFLILVNESNFFESWKLKRNRQLMANIIDSYLNDENNAGQRINFHWDGETYETVAGVVLVTHGQGA